MADHDARLPLTDPGEIMEGDEDLNEAVLPFGFGQGAVSDATEDLPDVPLADAEETAQSPQEDLPGEVALDVVSDDHSDEDADEGPDEDGGEADALPEMVEEAPMDLPLEAEDEEADFCDPTPDSASGEDLSEPAVPDTVEDVRSLLAGTEAELNRRFDDMEMVVMELSHQLIGAEAVADPATLAGGLRHGLDGVQHKLDQAAEARAAADQQTQDLDALLQRRFDRVDRKIGAVRQMSRKELKLLEALMAASLEMSEEASEPRSEADPGVWLAPLRDEILSRLDALQARVEAASEAPPPPSVDLDLTPVQTDLEQGFDRMAALLGGRDARLEAERKGLTQLRQGLEAVVTRFGELLTVPPAQETPDPALLVTALQEDLTARFAALQTQVQEASGTLGTELQPLHQAVSEGLDRVTAAVAGQSHRMEAERRALGQYLRALGALAERLDALATRLEAQDRPATDSSALEDRLSALEQTMAHRLEATSEALRDMSMVMAEMMARQERFRAENEHPSAKVS